MEAKWLPEDSSADQRSFMVATLDTVTGRIL
jgi:hypothetical protein